MRKRRIDLMPTAYILNDKFDTSAELSNLPFHLQRLQCKHENQIDMEPEAFSDIAKKVMELETFPFFDIAFCTLAAQDVREDLGGEPILEPFEDTQRVLAAVLIWYAIFFTPMDVAYRLAEFFPVKIIALVMKEIYRCRKVYDGVDHAAKLYPDAFLIMIVIGIVKGNGDGFTRLFQRLVRGIWTPISIDFVHPSYYTKVCFVASVIFVLHKQTELIPAPEELVYFGVVIFLVYFKMCYIILDLHDPFASFESIVCEIIFGGAWNKLAKLFGRGQLKEQIYMDSEIIPKRQQILNVRELLEIILCFFI
nr:unnamed protein product [Callosobruchus analis]